MAGLGFTRYSTGGSAVMLIDFYSINKATRLAVQWCGITPYLSGRCISVDSPSKLGERVIFVRDIRGQDPGRNTICADLDLYWLFQASIRTVLYVRLRLISRTLYPTHYSLSAYFSTLRVQIYRQRS